MVLADADEVDAELVGKYRFFHDVAQHASVGERCAGGVERDVAERIQTEFEKRRYKLCRQRRLPLGCSRRTRLGCPLNCASIHRGNRGDTVHSLLSDIGLAIIFAAVLGAIFYRLKLPLLLAYLVAGVLLGPNIGFHLITSQESISTVSEIGLVLLMFILGLEIDVRKIVKLGKAVLVNGVTQFVFCAALATGLFALLGAAHAFGNYTLVYLAVALSLSSTLIVVKVLSDRMELDTLTSRISLGILILQDIWAITFLAIQPRMTNLNAAAIGISIGSAVLLLGIGIGLARWVLPFVFHRIAKQPELMLIAAIAWCAVMAGFATGLKLSVEMGA